MTGNMYKDTETWNPLAGRCQHECIYCSTHTLRRTYPNCKTKYEGQYRIIEKEMESNLKSSKPVFVCAQNDLFEKSVPTDYIMRILRRTRHYSDTLFMFQTKNPERFKDFMGQYPPRFMLGTTIETDREDIVLSKAPAIGERVKAMVRLIGIDTYITIEPIVKFNLATLVLMMFKMQPKKIFIGADSKGHDLPEPSWGEIQELINALGVDGFVVELKDNLQRLSHEPRLERGGDGSGA